MSEIENICDVIKRFLNENNECIAGPECRTKNCNCKKEKYRCKIYNEFSLQHELGLYLRDKYENFIILFEKNVKDMEIENKSEDWVKYEIDIVIIDKKNYSNKYAIELKFPKNGQYPEQMFQFIKDIKFMEQVKEKLKFEKTYCLTLVNNPSFYSSKSLSGRDIKEDGFYKYFRNEGNENTPLSGKIKDPVKHKNQEEPNTIMLKRKYIIEWNKLAEKSSSEIRYYLIET